MPFTMAQKSHCHRGNLYVVKVQPYPFAPHTIRYTKARVLSYVRQPHNLVFRDRPVALCYC
jgi:hypothetical protein